jgi:hypothetical protein
MGNPPTNPPAQANQNMDDTVNQLITSVSRLADINSALSARQANEMHNIRQAQQQHQDIAAALCKATENAQYDQLFANLPTFDGTDKEKCDPWIDAIELACHQSGRDLKTEAPIYLRGAAYHLVASLDLTSPRVTWDGIKIELRRAFGLYPTTVQLATGYRDLKQNKSENLRVYINRYTHMHYEVNHLEAADQKQYSEIEKFLHSLQNCHLAGKVGSQSPRTLDEAMSIALKKETEVLRREGYRDSNPRTQVMRITQEPNTPHQKLQDVPPVSRPRPDAPFRPVDRGCVCYDSLCAHVTAPPIRTGNLCYRCGAKGHWSRECPLRPADEQLSEQTGKSAAEVVGTMTQHIATTQPVFDYQVPSLQKIMQDSKKLQKRTWNKVKEMDDQLKRVVPKPGDTTPPRFSPPTENVPTSKEKPIYIPHVNPPKAKGPMTRSRSKQKKEEGSRDKRDRAPKKPTGNGDKEQRNVVVHPSKKVTVQVITEQSDSSGESLDETTDETESELTESEHLDSETGNVVPPEQ